MPEGVAVLPVGAEQAARDDLPHALLEGQVVEAGGLLEQVVVGPAARDGRAAEHSLRGVGEQLRPGEQQAGQPVGHRGALGGGLQQLLGVEGIALGPVDDLPHHLGVGAAERGQVVGHLVAVERLQLHRRHRGETLELGEDPAQRVAAVEVVGAVGADEADALGLQHPAEEDQQVAGGLVGPVQVLEDEQHGPRGQEAEHRAEELLLRQARRALPAGVGAAGQQPAEDRPRVERRAQLPACRTQGVGEREVGECVAEFGALADEHGEPGGLGTLGQLGDQTGLADARVTSHEGHPRLPRGRGVEHGGEAIELDRPPDQNTPRALPPHVGEYRTRSRRNRHSSCGDPLDLGRGRTWTDWYTEGSGHWP